jgi:hypothetical protein
VNDGERRYRRSVSFSFEPAEPPRPWGAWQPKFESLTTDGPDRYFLVYHSAAGDEIRVQLAPAGLGPHTPAR